MSVISSPLSVAESVRDQLKSGKRDAPGRSFSLLLQLSLALSILILLVLLYDVVTGGWSVRSEEHTSELQSLMRISYAVFCLKKKKHINSTIKTKTKRKDIR